MAITGTSTCGPSNAPCGLPAGISPAVPAALADCYGLNTLTPQTAYVNGRPVLARMRNVTVKQGQCAFVDWQFYNPAGVPVDFANCAGSSSSSSSYSDSASCDNKPFVFKLRIREMLGGGDYSELVGVLQPDNVTVRFPLSNADTECPGIYFAEAVVFSCVSGGSDSIVVFEDGYREFAETPGGAVDGANTTFTLANRPTNQAGVQFTVNGLTLVNGVDFTVTDKTITVAFAPAPSSILFARYTQTSAEFGDVPSGAVDGVNKVFVLNSQPTHPDTIHFTVNGVTQSNGTDFTVEGNVLTMAYAPAEDSILFAQYMAIPVGYCQYYSNTFYLTIDSGLYTGEIFGPPSIAEVRLSLRDSGPAESMLLNNLAFSDEEIAMAIARPVQLWNETPPHLRTYHYTTTTFPFRYYWLEAIAGTLFLLAAEYYRRNNLTYSAANVSVNDLDKEPQYEAAGQRRLQMYKEFVRAKKSELNLNQFYGGIC
jgi:hypothetical protein